MRVQHNIVAMNSYRNYNNNTRTINKNIEKLSSGYKINRAGDDAAGLAISEKMRAQITGLEGAQKNAKDGISLVQTAEGALTEVHSMLNRMFELAEQSANGTYDNGTDRAQLQKEVDKLSEEINRIADSSNFNGIKLLDGTLGMKVTLDDPKTNGVNAINVEGNASIAEASGLTFDYSGGEVTIGGTIPNGVSFEAVGTNKDTYDAKKGGVLAYKAVVEKETASAQDAERFEGAVFSFTIGPQKADGSSDDVTGISLDVTAGSLTLQIGDTADSYNQLDVNLKDIHTKQGALNIDGVNIASQSGAQKAMDAIKQAINYVSDVRGTLGASQNRLEHTINNLSVMQENIQDAESTIRDTDVASEMMKYTKNSILVQSAQAMLAQANQQPQGVLQLLQ
jgi:flagellin